LFYGNKISRFLPAAPAMTGPAPVSIAAGAICFPRGLGKSTFFTVFVKNRFLKIQIPIGKQGSSFA